MSILIPKYETREPIRYEWLVYCSGCNMDSYFDLPPKQEPPEDCLLCGQTLVVKGREPKYD